MLLYTEAKIDPLLESQFAAGRLYATISSRPGQSGRADGYILEGKELEVRVLYHSVICGFHAHVTLAVLPQKNQDRQAEACSCLNISRASRLPGGAVALDAMCASKNRILLALYNCMTVMLLCSLQSMFLQS